MKYVQPKPFFEEKGERAVLLLHGFTGNSADVRLLGRYLGERGYTTIAPHYAGHGVPPEQLIETGPRDWWRDVIDAYDRLKENGYEQIAVAGLSLGGVFSLKLSMERPTLGVVPMCAPMSMESTDLMYEGVLQYAKRYKTYEGKPTETIEREVDKLREQSMPSLSDLRALVYDVRDRLEDVFAPTFLVQGKLDQVIDIESANVIEQTISSAQKTMKWYERSGHVITIGPEREQLYEDIYQFLETLDWTI